MTFRPQSFTVTASGILRVLITKVHISQAFDPNKPAQIQPPFSEFDAIWDTGATSTVITHNVVDACGLKPIGMVITQTANGVRNSEVYLVNIGLPNHVGYPLVRVTKGDIGPGADVLIGMDIIGTGDFAITNKDNNTAFSFRYPSMARIDFVEQSHPESFKVGRNDPCPCGSGKKYKKCHGALIPPAQSTPN